MLAEVLLSRPWQYVRAILFFIYIKYAIPPVYGLLTVLTAAAYFTFSPRGLL